ncbi:MAG TPA: FAD-dependent oxidoreductase [Candidatus Nanoarchaeia archaeon]|nr:FAD-dependent oxidoreductase [Candidatus Nanoarchaeia archaeon]
MKKVVIAGGGFAGSLVARKLERSFDVTLIDTKDYFEFTPSILRTLVEPVHVKKIQVLHSHYLHKAHLVKDHVERIDGKSVYTNGRKFPYDYLVIATGSRYNPPIKAENLILTTRAHELRNYAQQLAKAKSVLIIGGGLVGVELAAEIVEEFPQKKVTLVHSKPELIERNPKKARDYARKFLLDRKVAIYFNERVESFKEHEYKTNKNNLLKPDIAFLCTGIQPNYLLLEPYCAKSLDERKALCVNKFLQVAGFKNIFAAGDITAIKEEKTAQSAERQAELLVKNIIYLEQGRPMEQYQIQKRPMIISLGKWHGILVKNDVVITGLIPGLLKSLVEWKEMMRLR